MFCLSFVGSLLSVLLCAVCLERSLFERRHVAFTEIVCVSNLKTLLCSDIEISLHLKVSALL